MAVDLVADNKQVTAKARAKIAGPGIEGTVDFTEFDVDGWKYVHVKADLQGDPSVLTPGKHAMHIHEKGDCECEGFKCAGGHFDPGPSGNSDADVNHPFHAGDLPNLTVDDNGHGTMEAITSRVTLSKSPISILDPASAPEGTSIMLHAKEDPYAPGEAGSGYTGGPRLACGKIEAA
jgi:Cu-Zn family superoxide dismutase